MSSHRITFLSLANSEIDTIKIIAANRPVLVGDNVIDKKSAINIATNESIPTIIVEQTIRDELVYLPDAIKVADKAFAIDAKYTVPIGASQQRNRYAKYTIQDKFDIIDSPMNNVVQELLGERNTKLFSDDYWIPYDLYERKKKFPKAYSILEGYTDYYYSRHSFSDR